MSKKNKTKKKQVSKKNARAAVSGVSYFSNNINRIKAREIIDSKGTPTVEVDFCVGRQVLRDSVPSGISKGKKESI